MLLTFWGELVGVWSKTNYVSRASAHLQTQDAFGGRWHERGLLSLGLLRLTRLLIAQDIGVFLQNTIDESVRIQELLHVFGTRDDDRSCTEGGDGDFLTLSNRVPTATAFAGCGADTDARRSGCWAGFVPEEFGIDALIDRGFVVTPESVFLHENLVETVTANGLADVVVGVHHTDVELGNAGFGCLVTGPDSAVPMGGNELCERGAGHLFAADTGHLESAVLEDFDVRLLETAMGVIEAEAEDQGGLIEEALLGFRGGMKDVLHTDALVSIAELDLEDAFTDPPVGDEGTVRIQCLEIWDGTQMSSDCHCADT